MARPRRGKSKAKAASESSNTTNVTVPAVTLQTVAAASPIPALAEAANLAVQITTTVQKVRGNKDGFELLAGESRELVYEIFHANQNMKKEDLPADLREGLDQVLTALHGINAFAEKCSSRNRFWAFVRAGVDGRQIREYRRTLKYIGKFGRKVLEFPENKDKAEPSRESKGSRGLGSSSPGPSSIPTPAADGTGGSASPWGHGMETTCTGGNVEMNHASNVANNRDSGNTYSHSIVSTVNNNITIIAQHKRRRSRNRQRL